MNLFSDFLKQHNKYGLTILSVKPLFLGKHRTKIACQKRKYIFRQIA